MKVVIEDDDLEEIHAIVHDWMGLDLTNDQILELIREDDDFLGDYIAHGMDTCCRESLGSIIARKLVGRDWPTYGEGEQVAAEFHDKFVAAAKNAGYKVLQDS